MTLYRPKVYTASKLSHAEMWKALHDDSAWNHVTWTARWPFMAHLESGSEYPPSYFDFQHFWNIDITDVTRSDFVLLWGEETSETPLRGALVEAGAAIASGKTVLAINLSLRHTWSHHRLVARLDTLEEARQLLLRYYSSPIERVIRS